MMVGISKEDVLNWYQGLNASHRVEIICALLDHSLPFELRFLGSVIENLGRKDFHVLREAECRANSLHSSESLLDQAAILRLLSEGPAPTPMTLNPHTTSSVGNNIAGGHFNNPSESVSSTRPNPSQTQEQKAADENRGIPGSHPSENGLLNKPSPTSGPLSSSDSCTKGGDKCNSLSNNVEGNSDDDSDQRKDIWLHDWTKRRKLILYLSLLAATNHDSANLYFILMSDVEDLMINLEWLEDLEESVQDEILLLYTVGSHHPAFNFEQRTFLSAVLSRFKECMTRYSKHCEQSFHTPCPPNQILNHHYLPPQHFDGKFGYYFYAPQAVQSIQSSQSSSIQPLVGTANSETLRTPTYPLTAYPNFPVFMSPPHPQHAPTVGHHQQFQSHPFVANVTGSAGITPGSTLQSQQVSQHGQVSPSSANPQSTSAQPPGKVQVSSSNPGVPLQSHQSSVSTPTRTSSMASAVTAYQSQANSLDGDSEGSFENSWESPNSSHSSPFESPPQSLSPSRSLSPKSGVQSKAAIHTSSTMQNLSTSGQIASATAMSSSQPCLKNDAVFSSSNCALEQGISAASSAAGSRPIQKSNVSERKGRPQTIGGSSHNNVGPLSYTSSNHAASSSNFSSAIITTTSVTSLTVTTVASTPSSVSSPLGKSQSLPTQNLSHSSQCTNLPSSHSSQTTPQPCSSSNVLYSNLTSSGDCAQAHKNVLGSNSTGSLVMCGNSNSSVNTVNSSAYNCSNLNSGLSISSPVNSYPTPLPQHHLISPSSVTASNSNQLTMNSGENFYNGNPSVGLVNAVNAAYGNALKSSSTMHSQSPQGRPQQQKSNVTGNNQQMSNSHGGAQSQQSQQQQQHVIQQLMGQVVGQLHTSSNSINNVAGVVTHSMNTPLLSFGHAGGHNNHGHTNYSAYQTVGVPYGNMGAPGNYRTNSQGALLNRPAAFIPTHPGSHLSNQMVLKQQQDQRGHTGVHASLRQKNPSVMQGQNTPKRRTNNSSMSNASSSSSAGSNNIVNTSSSVMLQSQSGKSEEATEINDRTNNVLVVSANPSKNPHNQDRGKIYHHPNSGFNNGPGIIDRVTSSGCGISSSNSNTNSMMGSGNSGVNMVSNASVSGQPLHNTQSKGEENLLSDVGIIDYGVATASQMPAYHSSVPLYGHPGPGAAFIPMQNGYLSPSYFPNHLAGPAVGMNTSGPQGPPSTEILMNPGHMQHHYPFTFPFSIPPPHYGNPNLSNKTVCANNPAAKDASKVPLSVMGPGGSSVSNDSAKLMISVNDPGVAFGRPGPLTYTQSATIGGLNLNSPLIPMPSHSPMSAQSIRSRGVILEVGGQPAGAEFPSLSSLENTLMPPLDDPLEVNCRPRRISCYNCGSNTHVGPECKEASMEEMTRKQYRLNYGGPPSTESKEGE